MYVHIYPFGFNCSCLIRHRFIKITHQPIKLHCVILINMQLCAILIELA